MIYNDWRLRDFLFLLFCVLLFIVGINIEASDFKYGLTLGGLSSILIFAYAHNYFEKLYKAYILTIAYMIVAIWGCSSYGNIILGFCAFPGCLVICAILWILYRIRYGKW